MFLLIPIKYRLSRDSHPFGREDECRAEPKLVDNI
jgi:hypothetical protein